MEAIKKIFRHTIIYFLLMIGFLYLYVIDIDLIMHPDKDTEVKSKIDFVYQQF